MVNRFGEKLKHHRKGTNVSAQDIEDSTSICIQMLSKMEDSEISPTKIQIEQLAEIQNLGLSYETMRKWRNMDKSLSPLIPTWQCSHCGWPQEQRNRTTW